MLSSTVQQEALAPYHLYEMECADITGVSGTPGAGPFVQFFAKIDGQTVIEASYKTYTCPNAIACGSWVTRWMEGRIPEILRKLTADDLLKVLGGLPLGKEQCAVITTAALNDLIQKMEALEPSVIL